MSSDTVEMTAKSTPATSPARLAFLDGVRGLAALFVVLHHAYLTIWAGPHGPYGMPSNRVQAVANWMLFGRLAVDVFIVLSGYCLMLPVVRHQQLKGGALHFYRRRIRRIIPTYYASIALSLLLIWTLVGKRTGTHWDASLPVNAHALMNAMLLIQNFGPPRINHVFWSIAAECQIYLLFPLIVWLWFRIGGIQTLIATCIIVWGAWHWGSPYQVLPTAFWYLALFTFGAAAVNVVESDEQIWRKLRRWPWRIILIIACAIALWLCIAWGPYPQGRRPILQDVAVGAGSAALLIVMALHEGSRLRRVAEQRLLAAVGLFSYSLYLIHAPLLQVIWQYGIDPLKLRATIAFALLVGIGAPLIVGISYLFYLLFERRFAMPPAARSTPSPPAHSWAQSIQAPRGPLPVQAEK